MIVQDVKLVANGRQITEQVAGVGVLGDQTQGAPFYAFSALSGDDEAL
jgi:hypothetical protein